MKGWIYIISNQSIPNWLAVGCSDTDPEALVRRYGHSGIKLPYPFELQYALRTPYPQSLLQKIHEQLADKCVNPELNSDWFECDLLRAIRITRQIAGNSATGEAFYGQARQMIQQAQQAQSQAQQSATPAVTDTSTSSVTHYAVHRAASSEPAEIKQIRTVPSPKHGKRPSPTVPKFSTTPPAAPTQPDVATPPAKPKSADNPQMVKILMVTWVMLMIILVFLVAYLFHWI